MYQNFSKCTNFDKVRTEHRKKQAEMYKPDTEFEVLSLNEYKKIQVVLYKN